MRFASIILLCCLPFVALAQERAALVIGIGDYAQAPDLDGPRRDARAFGAALEDLGFEVTTLIDSPGATLKQALSDFAFRAETAEMAVIYYAGHQLSAGGENYLIPTDGPLAPAAALRDAGVALPRVLRAAGKARQMRLVILDNCHAAPVASAAPLSPPAPRDGTLVLTAGGTAACDSGAEGPGVFVEALIEAFTQPDVEISVMLDALRADLRSRSGGDLALRRFGDLEVTPYFLAPSEDAGPPSRIDSDPRRQWSALDERQGAVLMALARQGDARALLASAYLRLDPDDPRYDPDAAATDLADAAEAGSPEARYLLAQLYEEGTGVTQDADRALTLYEEAAAEGYAPALNDLGFIYLQGELGQAADADLARDYFRRAADRRHPAAMFNYAAMIDDGKVPERGAPDAALYLYRALRGGDATLLDLMVDEPGLFNSETRKALQRKLAQNGFYDGAIDGDYGPGTQAGIRAAYGGAAASAAALAEAGQEDETAAAGAADPAADGADTADAMPAEPAPDAAAPPSADATPEPGADENVTPVLRPPQARRE
ncbi:caspase family protein [Sulfitobacter sp. PS-8MA]|uniref:caspase family protein n=1 Tax=Sulfitobacter sp. PS-8MA TaxID=3237707 RepID=UPI0034C5CFB9